MKKIIAVMIAFVLVLSLASCSGSKDSVQQATNSPETVQETKKPSSVPTEKPTQKPTEKPTEAPKQYTGEELLTKTVPDILDLLDYQITVEQRGYEGSGMLCFYNDEKLPGFVFCSYDANNAFEQNSDLNSVKKQLLNNEFVKLSFIVMENGAKLTDSISSDMTYSQISKVINSYSLLPPAGQGLIRQDLTPYIENTASAQVTYHTSNAAINHISADGYYDEEFIRQEDPAVDFIQAYAAKDTSVASEMDYSSYLGWWSKDYGNMAGACVEFISINNREAKFRIQCTSSGAAHIAETEEIAAELDGNEIVFTYHDSFGNDGSGKITLSGDTIYVYAKPKKVVGSYAVSCDTEMTKN